DVLSTKRHLLLARDAAGHTARFCRSASDGKALYRPYVRSGYQRFGRVSVALYPCHPRMECGTPRPAFSLAPSPSGGDRSRTDDARWARAGLSWIVRHLRVSSSLGGQRQTKGTLAP